MQFQILQRSLFHPLFALALFFLSASSQASAINAPTSEHERGAMLSEIIRLINNWGGNTPMLDKAGELLDELIQHNPQYAPAYVQLARYHINKGYLSSDDYEKDDIDKAFEAIGQAISLDPDNPGAYSILASLHLGRGELGLAHWAIQRGREAGDWPWLDFYAAELAEKHGDSDAAEAMYRKLLDSDNTSIIANSLSALAKYHIRRDELDEAEALYRQRLALEPDVAWNIGNFASFLFWNRGDFEQAMTMNYRALSIMDYGMARKQLAYSLYGLWARDPENNVRFLEKASNIYPFPEKVLRECAQYSTTFIISEALVGAGIDIDARDADGLTALITASSYGKETVAEIIRLGANLELRSNRGWTALSLAANHNHLETAAILLDSSADINAGAYMDQPPLWYATKENHVEMIKLLAERGAEINRPDANGAIPIMAAAYYGNVEAAETLLEYGADLGATTIYGQTAADLAVEQGHMDVHALLVHNTSTWDRVQHQLADPTRLLQATMLAMLVLLVVMRLLPKLRPISLAIIAAVLLPTGIYASGKIFHFFI